jgi:hypothetical protein
MAFQNWFSLPSSSRKTFRLAHCLNLYPSGNFRRDEWRKEYSSGQFISAARSENGFSCAFGLRVAQCREGRTFWPATSPWNRVTLEATLSQMTMKWSASYGTWRLIIAYKKSQQLDTIFIWPKSEVRCDISFLFYSEGFSPTPNPQFGGSLLVGLVRLFIQHTCSCTPYLEVVSSAHYLRIDYSGHDENIYF